MKFKTFFLIATFLTIPFFASAEVAADLKKNIILDQQKLFIMDNMMFSEKEAEKFWPVFREYQEKNFEIDMNRSGLLSYYAANHKKLNDEQAGKIIERMFDIIEMRQALQKEFIFLLETEAILPSKKVFRYLQVEHYFITSEQYELIKKVPLLE